MTPSLTHTGLLVAGLGSLLVLAGALATAWPLVALGFVLISMLLVLYLLFMPFPVLLRRRHLEFAWWVPASTTSGGAMVANRPSELHLLLRNHAPFKIAVSDIRVMSSSAIELPPLDEGAMIPPRREVMLRARFTPRSAGYWFFHGMFLRITDRFGIFTLQLYFPNLLGIKVFPQLGAGRAPIPFSPRTGTSHERAGQRLLRQRGLGSDLREIRDHVQGDPFKRIAWKSTARTGKLMVKEFESEIMVTHWLLLDISSSMRSARPGRSKLDYGLSLCAGFARLALTAGDRVGLITFDHRIYSQVKAADGQPQLFRIIDRLMELHSIVDEDLTDLTDSELYAAVADYLAHQEGIDVSLPGRRPKHDDPLWAHIALGPNGEMYNANSIVEHVTALLKKRQPQGASWWWNRVYSSNDWGAQLRLFCRLSGLELPYRQNSTVLGKESGMAAALRSAGASRQSRFIVLISDLEELEELDTVLKAIRLARHHHHSLVVVAPFAPSFVAPPDSEYSRQVLDIFTMRAARQRAKVRQAVEAMGVPVISASPQDVLHLLLRRLSSLRTARRGAAM